MKNVGAVGSLNVVWDDLQNSGLTLRGGATAPTERLYNFGIGAGVTFPVMGYAVGDVGYFNIQTSHSQKLNTAIDQHFHYILPDTTTIGHKFKFQMDVVAAGIDGAFAVVAGSPFVFEKTVAAGDNTYHRYFEFPDMPAVNTTVSTVYMCKLSRIASAATQYSSEVYVISVDNHYQKDTIGSLSEATKT